VRWRTTFVHEVQRQLKHLGLNRCFICGSDHLTTHSYPLLALMGGMPHIPGTTIDPEISQDYLLRFDCRTCGYQMFFNSERFRTGDEPILISQGSEEEEARLDREQPL
jgi:hypothetical protein